MSKAIPGTFAKELVAKLTGNPITALGDYDEVVDSISDLIEVGISIDKALADGFQVVDLLVALRAEPIIREVIDDSPVFWEQFLKLRPAEALAAVQEVEQRLSNQGALGRVTRFVLQILFNSASTFAFVDMAIAEGTKVFQLWKGLRLDPKN